jgi:hypothetical protein
MVKIAISMRWIICKIVKYVNDRSFISEKFSQICPMKRKGHGRRRKRPERTSHWYARDPEKERRKRDGGWS